MGFSGKLENIVRVSPPSNAIFVRQEKPAQPDASFVRAGIESRNAARKAKDFKEADRIRDELLAQGIVLKDGPDGTTWELKR